MPVGPEKYTHDQREAVASAIVDRKMTAPRVVELAAAGELTIKGNRLEPFEVNENYTRVLAKRLRKRRAGEIQKEITKLGADDAIEALRRRLVAVADQELAVLERQKPGKVNNEELRQTIRCVREAQSIKGFTDPRPPAPGTSASNAKVTRGGMAGAILRAAAGGGPLPGEGFGNGEGPHDGGPSGPAV
jgi:hypothetical protein